LNHLRLFAKGSVSLHIFTNIIQSPNLLAPYLFKVDRRTFQIVQRSVFCYTINNTVKLLIKHHPAFTLPIIEKGFTDGLLLYNVTHGTQAYIEIGDLDCSYYK